MIQWIFFDVGNVILNDDPAMAFLYHQIYRAVQNNGANISLDEILTAREHSILVERNGKHFETVGKKFLARKTWHRVEKQIRQTLARQWAEFSPLMPGIVPVITTLSQQYNLGIIANQPREVVAVLEGHGLYRYFKIHGISQIVGKSKPDPKLFQWALDQAGCEPEQAIMIGDRVDNDVRPARSLGMKTIWLKLPMDQKGYQPKTEFERRYFESLRRACVSQLPPRDTSETPDGIAEDFDSILNEVKQL